MSTDNIDSTSETSHTHNTELESPNNPPSTTISKNIPSPRVIRWTANILDAIFPSWRHNIESKVASFPRIQTSDDYAKDLRSDSEFLSSSCESGQYAQLSTQIFNAHTRSKTTASPVKRRRSTSKPRLSRFPRNHPRSLTTEFHLHGPRFMAPFSTRAFNSNGEEFPQNQETIPELLLRLINEAANRALSLNTPNQRILIQGDIGCGKTTLITNIVETLEANLLKESVRRTSGKRTIDPILIDFEKIVPDLATLSSPDTPESREELAIRTLVEENIKNIVQQHLGTTGGSFEALINKVAYDAHIVLIFDNLDSLYQKYCKEIYCADNNEDSIELLRRFYPFLYLLFESFTSGPYGNLGLTTIFVARHDTADLLQAGLRQSTGEPFAWDSIDFRINVENSTDNLYHVLTGRLNFLQSRLSGKNNINIPRIDECQTILNSNQDFLESLNLLGVQGLRHLIATARPIAWTCLNPIVFNRFFGAQKGFELLHFTGVKTHYSQISEGIANIFLVNKQYRTVHPGSLEVRPDCKKSLLKDHLHTYWLKYLILSYICKRRGFVNEILEIFSRDHVIRSYEPHIVRLVLMSLSEIAHGRLIRPDIRFREKGEISSGGIVCTKRGRHLLNENTFWSFKYLSSVIEDEWLEFPNIYVDRFSNPKSLKHWFYTDQEKFQNQEYNRIDQKIDQVFLFLNILEISLRYERKQYPFVFKQLNALEIPLPNFRKIRKDIRLQITQESSALSRKQRKLITKKLIMRVVSFANYRERNKLSGFFWKNYYTGWLGLLKMQTKKTLNLKSVAEDR